MRGVARELGIRQPSLYEYFDSKLALYDAMFADGNRRLLARLDAVDLPDDPRRALKVLMRAFVEFAVEDIGPARSCSSPVRSPASSRRPRRTRSRSRCSHRTVALLRTAGMRAQGDVDCFIAMVGGLIAAQN